MKTIPRLLPLLAPLLLAGCIGMTLDAGALEPHVYLSGDTAEPPEVVGRFEEKTRSSWLLWGAVELDQVNPEGILLRELARFDGDAIRGLRVVTRRDFLDVLLTGLTLGLYTQRTMKLEGTVVRGASGPGEP